MSLQISIMYMLSEKFRFCVKHYSILPPDMDLDIVKSAKRSLNILVEANL